MRKRFEKNDADRSKKFFLMWKKMILDEEVERKAFIFKECFEVAKGQYKKARKLIPIYLHRFISAIPNEGRNPVFPVHQTDISSQCSNLSSCFRTKFEIKKGKEDGNAQLKYIRF